jgi:hypothetical protein
MPSPKSLVANLTSDVPTANSVIHSQEYRKDASAMMLKSFQMRKLLLTNYTGQIKLKLRLITKWQMH